MLVRWEYMILTIGLFFVLGLQNALASAADSKSILYIGDSISYGMFGKTIDNALREEEPLLTSEASCGSTPLTWLIVPGSTGPRYTPTVCGYWKKDPHTEERFKVHDTPKIEEELARIRPGVTVIQLGTNVAAGKNPEAHRASIRQMGQEIRKAGSRCIWIGPPDANSKIVTRSKLQQTNEMIRVESQAEGCFFIDTLSFTEFPLNVGDGIHPSPALATEWARSVLIRLMPAIKK